MIFSRACEYAIRTVLFVAADADGNAIGVPVIARELGVPSPTLSKVVQSLTRRGLLTSQKGPGGGVRLARPADEITVQEIAHAIDGKELARTCVLGLPGCSEDGAHCPLHDEWSRVRERILEMLVAPSVAQLAERLKDNTHVLFGGTRAPEVIPGSPGKRGGRS